MTRNGECILPKNGTLNRTFPESRREEEWANKEVAFQIAEQKDAYIKISYNNEVLPRWYSFTSFYFTFIGWGLDEL